MTGSDFLFRRRATEFRLTDFTAMVDVTMLLLFSFMIMAAVKLQKQVEVTVSDAIPQTSALVFSIHEEFSVAEIDCGNTIWVTDVECHSFVEVVEALKNERPLVHGEELTLIADPDSTYDKRIMVADAAAAAGFKKINSRIQEVN